MAAKEYDNSELKINAVEAQLWQLLDAGEQPSVYSILDGARDKRIEPMLNNSTLEYACLYEGKLSYAMQRAAPHIVKLEKNHPLTRKILRLGWGNSWGIFLLSSKNTTLSLIRNNLRRLGKVELPNGKVAVFRYYDPRIMNSLLPTCDNDQLTKIFGLAVSCILETDDGQSITEFKFSGSYFEARTMDLGTEDENTSDMEE